MKRNFTIGLTRFWWIPLFTGIILLGFGIWCLASPSTSIPVMAYIFSAGMLVAGCFDLGYGVSNTRANLNWGWILFLGLLEICCGVWLLCLPEAVLSVAFIYAVGIWMIVAAIGSLCEACFMSSFFGWGVLWMVILLLATIFLATIFITNPILGEITAWLWLSISLMIYGIYRIGLAFSLRSLNRNFSKF